MGKNKQDPKDPQNPQDAPVPKTTFVRSIKLVAWSFLGIRSRKGYQDDLAKVNPLHVVLVGFVAVLLIVVLLIGLVNWVVAT